MFLARLAPRTPLPLAALLVALMGAMAMGCDLEVRAHADVPLDSTHTLHVTYRTGAPSNARGPSHP
jgi:hypothetical protein